MLRTTAARKRLLALTLGVTIGGTGGYAVWRALAPATAQENVIAANQYNKLLAPAYEPGPPEGPPVVLKPNHRVPGWISTNSLGLRAPEPPAVKTKTRVLVLGDSYTFGFGLREQETFCAVLGGRLAGSVEVYNAGISGFEIADSVAQYFRVVDRIDPDVVIVTFVTNDLNDSYVSNSEGNLSPPSLEQAEEGMFASTANVLRMAWCEGLSGEAFADFVSRHSQGPHFFLMGLSPFGASRWQRYERELARLVADARKRDARIVVATFDPVDAFFARKLTNLCARLGVPVYGIGHGVNLGSPSFRLTWDPHPNGAANRAFADALLGVLVDQGVIPHSTAAPVQPQTTTPDQGIEAMCFLTARHWMKPSVTLTKGAQANLVQVLGGFEDTCGLLGGRAVLLVGREGPVKRVRVVARFEGNPQPSSDDSLPGRKLCIRAGTATPKEFEVSPQAREFTIELTPENVVTAPRFPFSFCEVDLRDPAVLEAPRRSRRAVAGIRVEQVALEE